LLRARSGEDEVATGRRAACPSAAKSRALGRASPLDSSRARPCLLKTSRVDTSPARGQCGERAPAVVPFIVSIAVATSGVVVYGTPADAAIPRPYNNCTTLNKRYPHGVGKVGARDKTTGEPVTNFKRSNRLYRTAMSYNRGLDRDKDGIACEKK
jgi:excalibur calcium-binding domain-containing protein